MWGSSTHEGAAREVPVPIVGAPAAVGSFHSHPDICKGPHVTHSPLPSTLNPQPSTLNPSRKLPLPPRHLQGTTRLTRIFTLKNTLLYAPHSSAQIPYIMYFIHTPSEAKYHTHHKRSKISHAPHSWARITDTKYCMPDTLCKIFHAPHSSAPSSAVWYIGI